MSNQYNHKEFILKRIFTEGLQEVFEWFSKKEAQYLRSIFDQVGFMDRDATTDVYYVPPYSITSKMNNPVKGYTPVLNEIKAKTYEEITTRHKSLSYGYLRGLSVNQLLFLLEKLGGAIPIEGDKHISMFDTYKIRAAKAIISLNRNLYKHDPGSLLINIDLSGIQKFIYNIVSRGALKNLRSRSFFVDLLCNHTINSIISSFNLHYVNVLTNGGGNINILSSKPSNYKEILDDISCNLNSWLLEEFNGRLYAVLSSTEISDMDMTGDVSVALKGISVESFRNKNKKFRSHIQRDKFLFLSDADPRSKSCEICNKDFVQKDQKQTDSEDDSRCAFCKRLVRLGNLIPRVKYIYVTEREESQSQCLKIEDSYYLLSDIGRDLPCAWVIFDDDDDFLEHLGTSGVPFFAKTYIIKSKMLPKNGQKAIAREMEAFKTRLQKAEEPVEKRMLKDEINSLSSDEYPAMLEFLAASSEGAKLIGALRMDADNIGKILHEGFHGNATLEKVSAFSRNLNYFFKLYLESICREKKRLLHVIYAGGDDLFALGAWNDIAELSLELGKAFRKYTCENMDFGLSGGFSIHKPKFPVSKMARLSLEALNQSKENLQPCWSCRKNWIECPLFRDGNCLRKDALTPFFTEQKAAFKYRLDKEFMKKYSTEPSRLKLSFKRKRFSEDSQSVKDEVMDSIFRPLKIFTSADVPQPSRGFMHNVLGMLEIWYSDGLLYLPRVVWLLQKQKEQLRRKVDKKTKLTMYDLYDWKLHFASPDMLSALHVPISWAILLMKEEERANETITNGRKTFEPVGS
jgi:CRISPR-associated protein Csm1